MHQQLTFPGVTQNEFTLAGGYPSLIFFYELHCYLMLTQEGLQISESQAVVITINVTCYTLVVGRVIFVARRWPSLRVEC